MGGKWVISVLLILFLTTTFFLFSSDNAEAVGNPNVTLAFLNDKDEQSADVRPDENCVVTFPCTVSVEQMAGGTIQDVIVILQGVTENSWPVTVNPATILVSPGEIGHVSVSITVPSETSCTEIDIFGQVGRGGDARQHGVD